MENKLFDISNAARLDAPERLESLPPVEVIDALKIAADDVIADIGAGTGYFALPMAQAAAKGRVNAVDAQTGMLEMLRSKAMGFANISLVQGEAEATTLESNSCDLVFLANVWHELDQRKRVLQEALRILKGRGRIAILDWRPDVERLSGPPLEHRIGSELAAAELHLAGFERIATQLIGRYSWLVQAIVPQK